jgi:hypothetical protein
MTPLTLGIWIAAIIVFISVGFALLPAGVDHPLPPDFASSIHTLYSWLHSFNHLLPVDTLVTVLSLGILVRIVLRMAWPSILWIIKTLTGAGE